MAAPEERYVDPNSLARTSDGLLVGTNMLLHLTSLWGVQRSYDAALSLRAEDIADTDEEISRLRNRQKAILDDRSRAVGAEGLLRMRIEAVIMKELADPKSDVHPIYRAVLQAPGRGGGALRYPDTLRIANRLGCALVDLDDGLRRSHEMQPVVEIGYLPNSSVYYHPDVRVQFGFTSPHYGLIPKIDQEQTEATDTVQSQIFDRSFLEVPVVPSVSGTAKTEGDALIMALQQSIRRYENGKEVGSVTFPELDVTAVRSPRIVLPTGNYLDTDQRVALYDGGEHGVIELNGPRTHGLRERVCCAIGNNAVRQVLIETYRDVQYDTSAPASIRDLIRYTAIMLGIPILRERV